MAASTTAKGWREHHARKLRFPAPTAGEETKADIENVKQIIAGVRTVRNQKNIAQKEQLTLQIVGKNTSKAYNVTL